MGVPWSGSGYYSAGGGYDQSRDRNDHSRTAAALRAAETEIAAAQRRNDEIKRR